MHRMCDAKTEQIGDIEDIDILLLSHTDISRDSRVLKAVAVAEKVFSSVLAVGVGQQALGPSDAMRDDNSVNLPIRSKSVSTLRKCPYFVRHAIVTMEIWFRVLLRCRREKPAVIHCHDLPMLPVASILKRLSGARLIYDAHELESNRNGLPAVGRPLIRWCERVLWRNVDYFITVSASIEQWYLETIGRKPSAVILNTPVLSENKHYNPNYLKNKYNIGKSAHVFIYNGVIGQGRGIDIMLRAFSKMSSDVAVVFMGDGPWRDRVLSATKRYPKKIFYHAAVPHNEVVAITRSADYGLCLIEDVSLSDRLCLPNKLFEYAFAGVPVIASAFPELEKTVKKYGLGVCCQVTEDQLVETVSLLVNGLKHEPCPAERLIDLSWQAQALKLERIYVALHSNSFAPERVT